MYQKEHTVRARKPIRVVRRKKQVGQHVLFALSLIALCVIGIYVLVSIRNGTSPTGVTENLQTPTNSFQTNAAENTPANNTNLTLQERYNKIVWLDAGHGGIDGGTSAMFNGNMYFEKDIALNIVLMVYDMFQQSDSGVTAFLTRDSDTYVNLFDRPALWNSLADLVVSVHADFYEGPTANQVCGIQVNYYSTINTGRVNLSNAQFAQIMQDHLVQETGARDRRIRGDRAYIVCAHSTMPALLIETGFMSNPDELALLVTEQYQQQIATAIYNAIIEAFGFIGR